uniref:Uncharacterized protein n=1 Tax=Arundo donax TaxID=35708 RepID=A0A0A8YPU1_ARUDO
MAAPPHRAGTLAPRAPRAAATVQPHHHWSTAVSLAGGQNEPAALARCPGPLRPTRRSRRSPPRPARRTTAS